MATFQHLQAGDQIIIPSGKVYEVLGWFDGKNHPTFEECGETGSWLVPLIGLQPLRSGFRVYGKIVREIICNLEGEPIEKLRHISLVYPSPALA